MKNLHRSQLAWAALALALAAGSLVAQDGDAAARKPQLLAEAGLNFRRSERSLFARCRDMPVEVIFKTGERSLLAYLLHPLTKRLAAAMTEE